MRSVGYTEPMVAAADGEMLSGSARLETVADVWGTDVEPIIVESDGTRPIIHVRTDIANAHTPEAQRIAIEANRVAQIDLDWNPEVLLAMPDTVIEALWDKDELSALGDEWAKEQQPKEAPEAQVDKAAELQKKWGTATGQLWQLGEHRLLCGDSTVPEVVNRLTGGVIETVVFDPPYDAASDVVRLRWRCNDALVFTDHRHLLDATDGWPGFRCAFVWDCVTSWYTPGLPLARGKFCLWFGVSKYDPDGAHYGEPGKAHTVRNTRGEYQYTPDQRGKHLSTVFQSPITREFDGHAHAKPVEWMRMLIANCTRGTVFDPFAGGGTSIVACEELKRKCLGIEIDAGNVAVILERVSAMGLEPRLVDRPVSRL
jgi:hypothetical protein